MRAVEERPETRPVFLTIHEQVWGESRSDWERPAKCPLFGMRLTCLLAASAWILVLAGAGAAARPAKKRVGAPVARSLAGHEIEDSSKTGAVGPGATGSRVVRAQILLDRARFSPGEIDGVYGDDFGIAVKGY